MSDISETDRQLIEQVRELSKHLLTPNYDTDYNILRFIKGCGYNPYFASGWLQRHMKARKAYEIDKLEEEFEEDEVMKSYFPSGILGTTGKNNKIVMIETPGRIDVNGLLKSIQATDFIRYRMKLFERIYKAMNEQEKLTQQQSGVVYVFDLEGISMDPFLIPVISGAYRHLWGAIMANYPEWIHVILIVNIPTFFNVLWKAFSQFLPEGTRDKFRMLSGDWKKDILEYIAPENLPVHWGGKMVDENGDPMYRSKIIVPEGKIPPSLYWKNSGKYQELPDDQLKVKTVSAGTIGLSSFFVPDGGTVLHYYVHSPDEFIFAIFFSEDPKETDVTKMDEIFPGIHVPGGLAPDIWHFVCERPGAYHIKFGNEKAWFLSITLKYRFDFKKPDGTPATVVPLNGA